MLALASTAMMECIAKAAMRDLIIPRIGIGLLLLNSCSLMAAARLIETLSLMVKLLRWEREIGFLCALIDMLRSCFCIYRGSSQKSSNIVELSFVAKYEGGVIKKKIAGRRQCDSADVRGAHAVSDSVCQQHSFVKELASFMIPHPLYTNNCLRK